MKLAGLIAARWKACRFGFFPGAYTWIKKSNWPVRLAQESGVRNSSTGQYRYGALGRLESSLLLAGAFRQWVC